MLGAWTSGKCFPSASLQSCPGSWAIPALNFIFCLPFDTAIMARSGLETLQEIELQLNCQLRETKAEKHRFESWGWEILAGKGPERTSHIHEECKRIIFQAGGLIFFSILGFHFLLQSLLLSIKTCATSSKTISALSNLRRGKLQLQLPPNWEQCKFRKKVLYFRDGTAGVETHLALRQWEPILIIKRTQWLGKEQQQGNFNFCFWGVLCILADTE